MILIITESKSLPINRWVWELIPSNIGGSHTKIQGTAGRIPGNLVSGNQTCQQPPTGTVALRELQWRYVLNTIRSSWDSNSYDGWEELGTKFTKSVNKVVTHKHQQNKQTASMATRAVIYPEKCSAKISWAGNCKYGSLITLSPLRGSPLTSKNHLALDRVKSYRGERVKWGHVCWCCPTANPLNGLTWDY